MEIAKLVRTALEETRMLILGAQILLGFEFSGVFRNGFMALPPHARYLNGVGLLLMIVTVALLIAPETYHHYVEYNADSGRFHQLISRMAGGALLPFALSLGVALFIVGESIGGPLVGVAAGCFFVGLGLGCWYALPTLRSRETGHKERAKTAREQSMKQETSLEQRITQMLTEARVILPGVQALLGFQLVSVLTQSFGNLPPTSKLLHAASLACLTVAIVLLIAPAAYHRIVFAGQDTEEVHSVGSRFIALATIPLALGLAGDLYVVLTEITGSAITGALLAGAALMLLVGLWHLFPVVSRLRRAGS
jgi:Family of unknown function (DUF6328)